MNTDCGIDAMNFSLPRLFLPIDDLAVARGIKIDKLRFGLGLESMSVCDVDEDVVTLAAEATWKLIQKEKLKPHEIGRIYLGTESAVDAAKPSTTYVLKILETKLEVTYGPRSLSHCDVLDMTFACVGAVDAMQNSLDWVRHNKDRKAIVIASDVAKYAKGSPGEYTQGAGAVAILISHSPRILTLDSDFGISVESTSDFFKPRRVFDKSQLLMDASKLIGKKISKPDAIKYLDSISEGFWGTPEVYIDQFLEYPIFDGPYSNDCYVARVNEALFRYEKTTGHNILNDWNGMVFHLPYAFQGRRMWPEISIDQYKKQGRLNEIETSLGKLESEVGDRKLLAKTWSKTDDFKKYVKKHIAPGELASQHIGNMYTGSIFMSLLSTLLVYQKEGINRGNNRIGFLSYGSGSKSKVFSGVLQGSFKNQMQGIDLFEVINSRVKIDFKTYDDLHQRKLDVPISRADNFKLKSIGVEDVKLGYRNYEIE